MLNKLANAFHFPRWYTLIFVIVTVITFTCFITNVTVAFVKPTPWKVLTFLIEYQQIRTISAVIGIIASLLAIVLFAAGLQIFVLKRSGKG